MKSHNSIVCIKKNKTDKEGYLFLRSKGRENRTKKSLGGVRVDSKLFAKYWNEVDMCFKSGMPNYKMLNNQIEDALEELEKTNGQIIPKEKDKKSFLTFWSLYIDSIKNHGTRKKNINVKIKFEKFLTSKRLSELYFSNITPELIKEFYDYLKTVSDPKVLTSTTATHYVKMVKMVIDRKLDDEPRLYITYPFTGVRFEKKKETDRPVLLDGEIDKLLNSELDKKLDQNRDKFLFQIFADGMRVSDLLLLRWVNVITGLPISKNTLIPVLPTGQELNPVLKYRMYKTDALVETPITYNICVILMKLIGHEWRTKQVLEDTMYNDLFLPTIFKGDIGLTFIDIEERINKACIAVVRKADKTITEYKGFHFKKDKEEQLKEAIDWLEDAKEKQSKRLIKDAMYCVARYIIDNNCLNNFVFTHLKNQFFSDIKTRPDLGFKDTLTEAQHQKLLNGETLYNRQLKQVAEETGVLTNMISHAARHSFAQLLLNEGAPTHEIMNRLRHASLATTDKYIRHKNFKNAGEDYTSKIGNKQKYRKT